MNNISSGGLLRFLLCGSSEMNCLIADIYIREIYVRFFKFVFCNNFENSLLVNIHVLLYTYS